MALVPPGPIETRTIAVQVGGLEVRLEALKDFEGVLDFYAREHPAEVELIPYYGVLWPSGLALAEHIAGRFRSLAGVRAVELGCGLGLPSIVAARLGARVLATDFHPGNERLLRRNAELNGLDIEYLPMRWESPPEGRSFALVLGSDLVYERKSLGALAACAARLCAPGGRIVLSDPGRDNLQEAVSRIEGLGFASSIAVAGDCFIVEMTRPCEITRESASSAPR